MIIEDIPGKQSFEELQQSFITMANAISRMESRKISDNDVETWVWVLGIRLRGLKVLYDLATEYLIQVKNQIPDSESSDILSLR